MIKENLETIPECPDHSNVYLNSNVYLKCQTDEFDYLMVLKNGTTILFSGAKEFEAAGKKWLHLNGDGCCIGPKNAIKAGSFERGMDVVVDEILYMVDAPEGS